MKFSINPKTEQEIVRLRNEGTSCKWLMYEYGLNEYQIAAIMKRNGLTKSRTKKTIPTNPERDAKILEMSEANRQVKDIAIAVGLSRKTVYDIRTRLRKEGRLEISHGAHSEVFQGKAKLTGVEFGAKKVRFIFETECAILRLTALAKFHNLVKNIGQGYEICAKVRILKEKRRKRNGSLIWVTEGES